MQAKWKYGLATLFTGYYAISYYAFKRMTRGKRKTPEMLLAPYTTEDQSFYHDVPFEHVSLQSRDGYRLYGRVYRNGEAKKMDRFRPRLHGFAQFHGTALGHVPPARV